LHDRGSERIAASAVNRKRFLQRLRGVPKWHRTVIPMALCTQSDGMDSLLVFTDYQSRGKSHMAMTLRRFSTALDCSQNWHGTVAFQCAKPLMPADFAATDPANIFLLIVRP
jgi:hypothetical protein